MSELRIIPVVFGGKHFIITDHRMQYDYGQVLDFKDLELPDSFEARFSNSPVGESVGQIGSNNRVRIPKQFFESGEPIYCYITVHDEVTDGRTLYTTKVPIKPSSERTEEEPEPEEESIITQAITALNTAVDVTSQKALEASESADRAEHAADGIEAYVERAEAAQQASESARDRAVQAETNSSASASIASEKASEAISSAATASQSAIDAEQESERAKSFAESSAQSAEAARQFAINAGNKAYDASESAQEASGYASSANTDAQTASQKASEAAQSASTATQAKTDAETAKQASETAQGLAESARDGAVTAKEDAESARDEAQDIVDGITNKVEQIDSNTDRIESLEDDRYKPYVTDTASGAVASFPDGAGDIPLKSCIVQVNPVQDLHGYDHPWPAGGGKNLIPYPYNGSTGSKNGVTVTVNNDGTIVLNGTATVAFYLWLLNRTESIPSWVKPSTEYVVSGGNGSFNSNAKVQMILYGSPSWTLTENHSSTPEDLSAYTSFAVVIQIMAGSTYNNTKIYPQIELGSTATSYAPYSNECPISGWTGCEVGATGKNLFDEPTAIIYPRYFRLVSSDNNIWEPDSNSTSFVFRCKPNTTYTVSCDNADITIFRIGWIAENPDALTESPVINDAIRKTASGASTITTGANAKAIVIQLNRTVGIVKTSKMQIEVGSAATAYEPYQGQTIPISWQTEAGTVYGAYVDVINGELVVDRAIVDLGTKNWGKRSLTDRSVFYCYLVSENARIYSSISENMTELCSNYPFGAKHNGPSNLAAAVPNKSWGRTFDGSTFFVIRDDDYADATAFKEAMSGVQLCYELAEPIHYPLTPTEIKTLLGQNNIWANTGDTSVTYRADTTLYISRLTEPDADMVADANITSGSYFMVGNNLYRATVNIASGAQVIEGTNATKVSLATALNEINQ